MAMIAKPIAKAGTSATAPARASIAGRRLAAADHQQGHGEREGRVGEIVQTIASFSPPGVLLVPSDGPADHPNMLPGPARRRQIGSSGALFTCTWFATFPHDALFASDGRQAPGSRRRSPTWLRHDPEAGGLTLDEAGSSAVEPVMAALARKGLTDRLEDLILAPSPRATEVDSSFPRIGPGFAARQGHSVAVDSRMADHDAA